MDGHSRNTPIVIIFIISYKTKFTFMYMHFRAASPRTHNKKDIYSIKHFIFRRQIPCATSYLPIYSVYSFAYSASIYQLLEAQTIETNLC